MLVISRKSGEEVVVPEIGITFRVLEVRGERVRLGITAPDDVRIYRQEVWTRIQNGTQMNEATFALSVPGPRAFARR
jgi:carbon storage regulator